LSDANTIASAFGIPTENGCYLLKICYTSGSGYTLTWSTAS
jgi:hypothetical protein